MNFNEYQEAARETAIYPDIDVNIIYPTLGLCGKAGEVAEKIKKIMRDKDGILTKVDTFTIAKELGDVLWYLSNIASEIEVSLELIARLNLDKLKDRQKRNMLGGSGDNR